MDWPLVPSIPADVRSATMLGIAAAALLVVVMLRAAIKRGFSKVLPKSVPLPTLMLGLGLVLIALRCFIPEDDESHGWMRSLSVLALLLTIARGGFLLLTETKQGRRITGTWPRIFLDIGQGVIYVGVFLVTLSLSGVQPGSILTTSALLTAVLGLSLQDTLGNLFAGLTLEMQEPFEVGDWVEIDGVGSGPGRVLEVNWRATRILTLDRVEVVVPNGAIAKGSVSNYSKPSKVSRRKVTVSAAYEAPPHAVIEALEAALVGVPGALDVPAPTAMLANFGASGIDYDIFYYTSDFKAAIATDAEVRARVWYAFERAGIGIPFPQADVHLRTITDDAAERDEAAAVARRREMLGEAHLFRGVEPALLDGLAKDARTKRYAPGELVLQLDGTGQDLFIVADGEVEIFVPQAGRSDVVLAHASSGDMFGERAFLTGERRAASARTVSASTLVCIDHEAMRAALEADASLADHLGYHLTSLPEIDLGAAVVGDAEQTVRDPGADELVGRIRRFFGLR